MLCPHERKFHNIVNWWITEALEYSSVYEKLLQAYYRAVKHSPMIKSGSSEYQSEVVVHVRNITLYSVVSLGLEQTQVDFMQSEDTAGTYTERSI